VEREVPQEETDAVKKLLSEIDRAKQIRKKFIEETLPQFRRYAWGTMVDAKTDSESQTRTNLIFATMATLLPHIYAKNPEIAVTPTEAVGEDQYEKIKEFCKTAQVMLNDLFIEEAKMKKRQKSNIRSAMQTSVGWLKLGFQKSLQGDPIIVRRANDIQDNLRRIEYLTSSSKKETDFTKLNEQRAELSLQLKTIMDSPEMKIFKGFVIDRVQTEDMFILDESIVEFDDYVSAKRLCHQILMTDDEYAETFGGKPGIGAVNYEDKVLDEWGNKVSFSDANKITRRAVYEVWDKTTNTICVVCDGVKGYAKAPYILNPASERWYSFYALGFNVVEGRWRPLSDVELLIKLQQEYNTTRYLFSEARKESIPTRVFRKAGNLTEEDIKNLSKRRARDWIGIEGSPTVPLTQDIMQLEGIKIDPQAYDVTIIRNDMDMLVGMSDASRANLIQAKTATEAEILKQALQNRVAERQDAVEDLTAEMATAALEIMLQEFKLDEVKQIVGEGAVWPELTDKQDIFRQVRISVRAGSTGKPNLLQERESWTQLMPVINDTITQVMEMRVQGQFDLAQAKIELLKETLRRYDEKLDVDQFIPKQKTDENGQPVAMSNAIMQVQQMQEEGKKLQQELEALKQQNTALNQQLLEARHADNAKVADIQAKQAIATAQEQAKASESAAKTAEAQAREAEAAAKEDRLFREKQYQLDKEAETTRYKLDREKETRIAVEELQTASNERIAEAKNKATFDLQKQTAADDLALQAQQTGAEKDKSKGANDATATMKAAAESLQKAALAVTQSASMDRVPEYNPDGSIKIVRAVPSKAIH
jgi:hypothetical protein